MPYAGFEPTPSEYWLLGPYRANHSPTWATPSLQVYTVYTVFTQCLFFYFYIIFCCYAHKDLLLIKQFILKIVTKNCDQYQFLSFIVELLRPLIICMYGIFICLVMHNYNIVQIAQTICLSTSEIKQEIACFENSPVYLRNAYLINPIVAFHLPEDLHLK